MSELSRTVEKTATKKKEFSQADHIATQNLCRLWAEFRAKHLSEKKSNMTQEKAAIALGWTQSNLSQYLNGIVPIGFKAAQKLASLFECKISDIRPDYRDISDSSDEQRNEVKALLSEMKELLNDIRSGKTDPMTAHQKVEMMSQKINLASEIIAQSA